MKNMKTQVIMPNNASTIRLASTEPYISHLAVSQNAHIGKNPILRLSQHHLALYNEAVNSGYH